MKKKKESLSSSISGGYKSFETILALPLLSLSSFSLSLFLWSLSFPPRYSPFPFPLFLSLSVFPTNSYMAYKKSVYLLCAKISCSYSRMRYYNAFILNEIEEVTLL